MRIGAILFALLLGACQSSSKESKTTRIVPVAEGQALNAAFLMIDGVYNSELMAPYDIFQHTIFHTEGGISVFTVSPDRNPVTTFEGFRILPDYSFDDPNLPEIDILVVPSAEHNMDTDLDNEVLIDFVRQTGTRARYVMSLCDGAFVLAKAGLVDEHESTTFPSDIPRYREMFPHLTVHESVSFVHDRNLLTSAGGAKSYDVSLYLVHYLYGEKVAKGVGRGLVIDWDPSNYSYTLVK